MGGNVFEPSGVGGYSIRSSDQHKFLLNRLAQKSGMAAYGEFSSQVGGSSQEVELMNNHRAAKDGSSGEINWSDNTAGQLHHFNGIVRVETSPQSKKVSHRDNWNLSPISSQVYNDAKAAELRAMAMRQNGEITVCNSDYG